MRVTGTGVSTIPAAPVRTAGNSSTLQATAGEIQKQGLEFTEKVKPLLFGDTYFKTVESPDRAAKLAAKGDRLHVSAQGSGGRVNLAGAGDLRLLGALTAAAGFSAIPDPSLAQALANLARQDATWLGDGRSFPEKLDAFCAYKALTDPDTSTSLQLRVGRKSYEVLNRQDAMVLAAIHGDQDIPGVGDPELARGLRGVRAAGLKPKDEDFLHAYDTLAQGQAKTLSVCWDDSWKGTWLGHLSGQELHRPEDVLKTIHARLQAREALQKALGYDGDKALEAVLDDRSERPLRERVELAQEVFALSVKDPEALYQAIVESTPGTESFGAGLDLAREVDQHTKGNAAEVYARLLHGFDEWAGATSPQELRHRYLELLGKVDGPVAERIAEHLASVPSGTYDAACQAALLVCDTAREHAGYGDNGSEVALKSLDSLHRSGRLLEDSALVANLIHGEGERGLRRAAPAAYDFLLAQVPEQHRGSMAAIFGKNPDVEALETAWRVVAAQGEEQVGSRQQTWLEFFDRLSKSCDRGGEACQALARASEPDDFEFSAQLYREALEATQGDPEAALEAWQEVRSLDHPELVARLHTASGSLEKARGALRALDRLPGAGRPLEERVNALGALLTAQKGELAGSLGDYQFLALRAADRSLEEVTGDFLALRGAMGSGSAARRALEALGTAPTPTARESLLKAAEVTKDLEAAGQVWQLLVSEDVAMARPRRLEMLDWAGSLSRSNKDKQVAHYFRHLVLAPIDHEDLDTIDGLETSRYSQGDWRPGVVAALLDPERSAAERKRDILAFRDLVGQLVNVERALGIWQQLAVRPEDPAYPEHRDCLIALTDGGEQDLEQSYRTVQESRRPGDNLVDVARIYRASKSPEQFSEVYQGLKGNPILGSDRVHCLGGLLDTHHGSSMELAPLAELVNLTTTPIAAETSEDRLEVMRGLLGFLGDARAAWEALTNWVPPGEDLLEDLKPLQTLASTLGAELAVEAVRQVRQGQASRADAPSIPEAAEQIQALSRAARSSGQETVKDWVSLASLLREGDDPSEEIKQFGVLYNWLGRDHLRARQAYEGIRHRQRGVLKGQSTEQLVNRFLQLAATADQPRRLDVGQVLASLVPSSKAGRIRTDGSRVNLAGVELQVRQDS